MSKEVFVAVLVGFILGLIITFGIWTANKNLAPASPAVDISPSPVVIPTPIVQAVPVSLTILTPADESVQNTDTVTISGKTYPNATIAISYESGETIIRADSSGSFSSDFKLDSGYNRLTLTAFDNSGASASQNLLVTYTTSKL